MNADNQYLLHTSSSSILISTPEYTLIRFHCPVAAECIMPVAGIDAGTTVWIEGVYHHSDQRLAYLVNGLQLPYHYFKIKN